MVMVRLSAWLLTQCIIFHGTWLVMHLIIPVEIQWCSKLGDGFTAKLGKMIEVKLDIKDIIWKDAFQKKYQNTPIYDQRIQVQRYVTRPTHQMVEDRVLDSILEHMEEELDILLWLD